MDTGQSASPPRGKHSRPEARFPLYVTLPAALLLLALVMGFIAWNSRSRSPLRDQLPQASRSRLPPTAELLTRMDELFPASSWPELDHQFTIRRGPNEDDLKSNCSEYAQEVSKTPGDEFERKDHQERLSKLHGECDNRVTEEWRKGLRPPPVATRVLISASGSGTEYDFAAGAFWLTLNLASSAGKLVLVSEVAPGCRVEMPGTILQSWSFTPTDKAIVALRGVTGTPFGKSWGLSGVQLKLVTDEANARRIKSLLDLVDIEVAVEFDKEAWQVLPYGCRSGPAPVLEALFGTGVAFRVLRGGTVLQPWTPFG